MGVRVRPGFKEAVERAAAGEGLSSAEMVRKAIDERVAKGGGSPVPGAAREQVAAGVVAQVEAQVERAVAAVVGRQNEGVARALVLIAERLDGIEAAQGRRAA
jgi:hypothetical protein